MSDFYDVLLLFMKMKKESFSRFGSKHKQKPFWRAFSPNMSEQIQTLLDFFLSNQLFECEMGRLSIVVRLDIDILIGTTIWCVVGAKNSTQKPHLTLFFDPT